MYERDIETIKVLSEKLDLYVRGTMEYDLEGFQISKIRIHKSITSEDISDIIENIAPDVFSEIVSKLEVRAQIYFEDFKNERAA